MTEFTIHNLDTAPSEAQESLQKAREEFGMIPNVLGIMADCPPLLNAYMKMSELFAQTSLTDRERTILLLTVSFENDCDYCMAAHTAEAKQGELDEDIIQALREGTPIKDQRLEALRKFAANIVRQQGNLSATEIESFLSSGFTRTNILEIILAVTIKTLTNYTNHIAETPLDQAMQAYRWEPPEK